MRGYDENKFLNHFKRAYETKRNPAAFIKTYNPNQKDLQKLINKYGPILQDGVYRQTTSSLHVMQYPKGPAGQGRGSMPINTGKILPQNPDSYLVKK